MRLIFKFCIFIFILAISMFFFFKEKTFNEYLDYQHNKHNLDKYMEWFQQNVPIKKNCLNNVPLILYINMDKSTERNQWMIKQLNKCTNSYKRIPGVLYNNNKPLYNSKCLKPTEKGCIQAHYNAIKIALKSNVKYALILEDDISLHLSKYWTVDINNILNIEGGSNNWDIIRLFGFEGEHYMSDDKLKLISMCDIKHNITSCAAYLISRNGMLKIKNNTHNFTSTFDNKCQQLDFDMFSCKSPTAKMNNFIINKPYILLRSHNDSQIGNSNTYMNTQFYTNISNYLYIDNNIILPKPSNKIYRLGYVFFGFHKKDEDRTYHITNFPSSIIYKYLIHSKGKTGNYNILTDIVYKHHNLIQHKLNRNTVLIHIRLGDVIEESPYSVDDHLSNNIEFKHYGQYVFPISYFQTQLKKFNVENIIFVTGNHFKHIKLTKSTEYIKKLTQFFKNIGYNCSTMSNTDADIDFLYLCLCDNLITTGGGFSKLAKKCNYLIKQKTLHTQAKISMLQI